MIRFLSEVFGISHVKSSAMLAFFLILTFKVCPHYLGKMKELIHRTITINNVEIAEIFEHRALPSASNSVPVLEVQSKSVAPKALINQENVAQSAIYMKQANPSEFDGLYQTFVERLKADKITVFVNQLSEWIKKTRKRKARAL